MSQGGQVMAHEKGRLDFTIVEQEFPVTVFRRKPSAVWAYVETPGHIAVFTHRGKRECVLMSIETHACLSGRYDEEIAEVERLNAEYHEKRKATGRRQNVPADY